MPTSGTFFPQLKAVRGQCAQCNEVALGTTKVMLWCRAVRLVPCDTHSHVPPPCVRGFCRPLSMPCDGYAGTVMRSTAPVCVRLQRTKLSPLSSAFFVLERGADRFAPVSSLTVGKEGSASLLRCSVT